MTSAARAVEPTSAELLGEAVHQNGVLSTTGFLERTFTFAFRSMVYAQIWEDPRADLEALELTPTSRVMTIASGGCNVMSYLTANPAQIYAVDLNRTHVALNKLKLAAAVRLPNHATFLRFFGGAHDYRNVRLYDDLIAPHVDAETRGYWEGRDCTGRRRISRFGRNFYRYGLLGRFIGSAHLAAKALGADLGRLTRAQSLTEQREIFEAELAPLFKKPLVRWVTSNRASLFGLGIPPAQYDALCDHGQRHMADVLYERVERLAAGFDLRDNYFAWQAFARSYDTEAQGPLPPYLQKENFALIKTRATRVTVLHANMIHFLRDEPAESLDRYVLLDAQDWMDDDTLTCLWREITRTARPGSRVIFRTAGEKTILPGRVPGALLSQWTYDTKRSAEIFARDRSAIYGGFHLYIKAE
jgi:S-adenosylmethionine-diacylglycerol 3-amino-3-carboxypropyl transferase